MKKTLRPTIALLLVGFLVLTTPSKAQGPSHECFDLSFGRICYGGNELEVISTIEDPPAVRLSSYLGKSLGKLSFNRMRSDDRQEELCIIQGKEDPRYPSADPGMLAGEILISCRLPNMGSIDKAMVPIVTLRSDGVLLHVSVYSRPSARAQ